MVERGIVIEEALMDDVDGIFALHVASMMDTYTGVTSEITDSALRFHFDNEVFQSRRRESIQASITHAEPSVIYVAREGEDILGFSGARVAAEGLQRMHGLYVARQGLGIGTALFNKALDWHNPKKDIYLTVVPGTRAVAFHRSFGFRETGYKNDITLRGGQILPNIEMKLAPGERKKFSQ